MRPRFLAITAAGLMAGALLTCLHPSAALAQYGQNGSGTSGTYGSQQGGYGSQQGAYGSQSGSYGSQQRSSGLEAGGLAPPSSADAQSQQTEQKLEEAEEKDSGRGLEFLYLNVEGGITHLGLQTFQANDLVDAGVVSTSQTGPTFGAGLGLRFLFLTAGARFRLSSFSDYQLWTLGGEVGLRIPLGSIEPHFSLGGGFAKLGSFDAASLGGASSVSISGYDIRAGFGVDLYVTPVFSIGGNLTGEVLGLTRGAVSSPTSPSSVYAKDGSSVGLAGTLTLVAGLHF